MTITCLLLAAAAATAPAMTPSHTAAPGAVAASDLAAVEETVRAYFRGGDWGDAESTRRAFHPSAHIRFVRDGALAAWTIEEYLAKHTPRTTKAERTTRILSLDVAGDVAAAKVELEYATFTFTDYLQLIRLDGEWRIVSKVFHRRPK